MMNEIKNKAIARLQFITHPTEKLSPTEQARQVLEGGCQWIQLRMKKNSPEEIYTEAMKIKALKAQFDFTLIINDHPELALKCEADGVHLGKQDCSPAEILRLFGPRLIIGGTANTIDDVVRLVRQGVDYIGLGPFRFTSTKENLSPVLGFDGYRRIRHEMKTRKIQLPVVAIGGIKPDDTEALMQTGLHGLAISSSIWKNDHIAECTKEWLRSIQQACGSTQQIF